MLCGVLGASARDALEGNDIPPEVPLVHLVRDLGEFICVSTVQKRFFFQLFKLAHDTESDRKVDRMLLVDGLKVLNSEAKPNVDRSPCERQFLKNLRINHAIHIVAAERGMSAMVCGLHSQGDIFHGGAASKDIIDLPTNKAELASFLSGPSAIVLWNYAVLDDSTI